MKEPSCPMCGSTSIGLGMTSETLVGYQRFYKDGIIHDHDDNCRVTSAVCDNGHSFFIRKRNRCPNCDWVGREKCFCDTDVTVVI